MPVKRRIKRSSGRPVPKPQLELMLKHEHSVELVQTAVAAIFFDIVWMRKVFGKHEWQTRIYNPDDVDNTYDAFIQGNESMLSFPPNGRFVWHVPSRGHDKLVDKLMNCLDSCVKEPIEKGYLKKIQLCFHACNDLSVSEKNLIESYSLSIDHNGGPGLSQASQQVRDHHTQQMNTMIFSEGRTKLGDLVQNLFEKIYQTDEHGRIKLGPLPDHFRMNILAEYNTSAPPGYQPPYFKAGDAATVAVLDLCSSGTEFMMDTGYHKVRFGLFMPGSSHTPTNASRGSNEAARELSRPRDLRVTQSEANTQDLITRHSRDNGDSQGVLEQEPQQDIVRRLNTMGRARIPSAYTQDTQRLDQPQSSRTHQSGLYYTETSSVVNPPPYTQQILQHLHRCVLENAATGESDDLDESQIAQHDRNAPIKCSCQCQDVGDHMIYCVQCHTCQHADCYGYWKDERPSEHLCYSCLAKIRPEDESQLLAAADCSVKRHVLSFIHKNNTVSYRALTKYLNRDKKYIDEIIRELETSGLLHKTTARKLQEHTFSFIRENNGLFEAYCNPNRFINNLFAMSEVFSDTNNVPPRMANTDYPPRSLKGPMLANRERTSRVLSVSQERDIHDDSTRHSESTCSPQSSLAQHSLNIEQGRHGSQVARMSSRTLRSSNNNSRSPDSAYMTPSLKRFANFDSPVEGVKRTMTSQISPMSFHAT